MKQVTDRLLLLPATKELSGGVTAYYQRNRDFLTPFDPVRSEMFFTQSFQEMLLEEQEELAAQKKAYYFYLVPKADPNRVIGLIGISSIVWGAFQSCFLGYKLDKDNLKKGYMHEALQEVIHFVFSVLGLHRIEANVMPKNMASCNVLEKLGFHKEGLAKEYLCINGIWEDHIHYALLNKKELQ